MQGGREFYVDSDIKSTIDRLEQRTAKLQQIKQMLWDEFGKENEPKRSSRATTGIGKRKSVRGTRKTELTKYLQEHGPQTRQQMLETNIPLGTLSYLLNDKDTFYRLQDGRWDLAKSRDRS